MDASSSRPPHPSAADRPIRVGAAADGSVVYLVDVGPEALPAVRSRDIERAWDAARGAASACAWGVARALRFQREDGSHTDLALADRDAACWAGAVDTTIGLDTRYGLSLCLRLLALVDLLARAPWMTSLYAVRRNGAELHPALLRTAASLPLTQDACFDEHRFRARLGHLFAPGLTGASA